MTPDQFLAALKKLGYLPQSKKTAEALGVSVRQLQRWGSGENEVTPTIERLLGAYSRIAADPKQRLFHFGKAEAAGAKKKRKKKARTT